MIPDWIFKLFAFLKGNKTEESKVLMAGYKGLFEEYRIKIEKQENRIKELEGMKGNLENPADRETMLEDEQEFHLKHIRLLSEHRDALEELYFLRYEIKRLKE